MINTIYVVNNACRKLHCDWQETRNIFNPQISHQGYKSAPTLSDINIPTLSNIQLNLTPPSKGLAGAHGMYSTVWNKTLFVHTLALKKCFRQYVSFVISEPPTTSDGIYQLFHCYHFKKMHFFPPCQCTSLPTFLQPRCRHLQSRPYKNVPSSQYVFKGSELLRRWKNIVAS